MEWLDAAKGIGIVLVVIGHAWKSIAVRDPIYAFHMPFFFIAAGYVAKPAPLRDFAVKQWRALGVPYIAFLACLMAVDPLIEGARGWRPMFRDWGSAVQAGLMGGTSLHGPLTVFWFVPCLMIARLAQVMLYKLWPDARDWRWALSMAVVMALGVWWGRESNFSPLGVLAAPVALAFLWLGALWRTVKQDRWLLLACAALSVAAIVFFSPLAPLNMKYGEYGARPFVTLPLAFVLSLGLCWLTRWMAWRPFVALGRMSLVIMFLHVPVIHYLRPYFGVWSLTALAVILPVMVYYLLDRFKMGRTLFLGTR